VDRPGEKVTALILAGGFSRRMGCDKAWLELGGVPLVERVSRRVLPLADELLFSTNNPDRFESLLGGLPIAARLVADQAPGSGPLAGIASGLRAARHDLVLVLAADMPFVQVELLSQMAVLAADYQAVVPKTIDPHSGELAAEPLHAFYRRSCIAPITAHLQAGQRRIVSFLDDVRTRWVLPEEIAAFDPDFLSFRNLNTPEDWDLAVSYFAHH
jgi:molybdopterin-guanine dinucleotide biosynthesis protein A